MAQLGWIMPGRVQVVSKIGKYHVRAVRLDGCYVLIAHLDGPDQILAALGI